MLTTDIQYNILVDTAVGKFQLFFYLLRLPSNGKRRPFVRLVPEAEDSAAVSGSATSACSVSSSATPPAPGGVLAFVKRFLR